MENLWHISVKPCEIIKLPFGMVNGINQKNDVFEGRGCKLGVLLCIGHNEVGI